MVDDQNVKFDIRIQNSSGGEASYCSCLVNLNKLNDFNGLAVDLRTVFKEDVDKVSFKLRIFDTKEEKKTKPEEEEDTVDNELLDFTL